MRAFEEEGLLDRFCFVLVSDHGHVETRADGYFDICGLVDRELDIPATNASASEKRSWRERWKRFGPYAAVVLDAGNRSAMLYLRRFRASASPEALHPWTPRPTLDELRQYPTRGGRPVDLIAELLRQEALELVSARAGPDAVTVFSRRGQGLIRRRQLQEAREDVLYSYSVLAGEDPLGYTESPEVAPLVGTGFHPGRKWLQASVASRYPDFVSQMVELMDSPQVGDLVVFAAPGWSFHPRHASDHGGPLREEMLVPLVVSGPGIVAGEFGAVRQVDVLPTILEYLGRPQPTAIDGQSFLDLILDRRRTVELVR